METTDTLLLTITYRFNVGVGQLRLDFLLTDIVHFTPSRA